MSKVFDKKQVDECVEFLTNSRKTDEVVRLYWRLGSNAKGRAKTMHPGFATACYLSSPRGTSATGPGLTPELVKMSSEFQHQINAICRERAHRQAQESTQGQQGLPFRQHDAQKAATAPVEIAGDAKSAEPRGSSKRLVEWIERLGIGVGDEFTINVSLTAFLLGMTVQGVMAVFYYGRNGYKFQYKRDGDVVTATVTSVPIVDDKIDGQIRELHAIGLVNASNLVEVIHALKKGAM